MAKISQAEKRRAVSLWLHGMSQSQLGREFNVTHGRISQMVNSNWWAEVRQDVEKELDRGNLGELQTIAKEANEVVLKRLRKGDQVIGKDGEIHHKGVSARDASAIAVNAYDRLQIAKGRATQITGRIDLTGLAEAFTQLAEQHSMRTVIDSTAQLVSEPVNQHQGKTQEQS